MNIIFYYGEKGDFMTSWPQVHFLNELERLGHAITVINPYSFENLEQANEYLIATINKNQGKWKLFMNAYGSDLLFLGTMKELRKCGIPSLLICFDNLHAPFMHKSIAPFFDLVWLTSFETKSMFEKWGCNCLFQPYAANPYTYFPQYGEEVKTVGFIGTPYGVRIDKINDLVNSNINCTVYSDKVNTAGIIPKKSKRLQDYWKLLCLDVDLMRFPIGRKVLGAEYYKRFFVKHSALDVGNRYLTINPSVPFDKMNELYSNFSLSLGITELWDTYLLPNPVHKLHLRTFEIPMCGGLQLVSHTEELANYFEDGKEIVLYSTKEEYLDKAAFFLNDNRKGLRQKMKMSARFRAEHEHTWAKRFENIFKIMKIN